MLSKTIEEIEKEFEVKSRSARCDKHDQDGTMVLCLTCSNCIAVKKAYIDSQTFLHSSLLRLVEEIKKEYKVQKNLDFLDK